MKIQTKIFFLTAICSLVLITLFFGHLFISFKSINNLNEQYQGNTIDKILKLKGEYYQQIVKDYSGWDEMLSFAKKPDSAWTKNNIDNLIESTQISIALVYNKNTKLVYNIYDTSTVKLRETLDASIISESFQNTPYCHFFHYFKNDLYEFYGASIVPTSDAVKRKTKPQGYFIIAKKWNILYINDIESLTNHSIQIRKNFIDTSIIKKQNPDKLYLFRSLTDYSKQPIATASFSSENVLKKIVTGFLNRSIIFILFVFVIIFFVILYVRKIIIRPINLISKSLNTNSTKRLASLKTSTLEINQLTQLIFHFFKQREDLQNKIDELNKYFTAIEQNYAAIVITDSYGNIEYVNPQFSVTTGYSFEELIGKSPGILKAGKTTEETYAELWNTIKKGKVWQGEFVNKKKDDEEYIVKVIISPIINHNGKISNYVVVEEDITKLRIAEQALTESEKKLAQLLVYQTQKSIKLSRLLSYVFEHTKGAIAFFEIEGDRIMFSVGNAKWANALGLSSEEMEGKYIEQVTDAETSAMYRKYINQTLTENSPVEDIASWKGKELHITVIPIKDENNIMTGCASFVYDITEQQQAKLKMHKLEQKLTYTGVQVETNERRKLAADLHDNVGPLLSSMNMYLSSLSRKPEVQAYSELLKDIHRILKEAIASVREISNNISPQILTSFGLTSALNVFFETKRKLISVNIDNNIGDYRFAEVKEVLLYNIIKEVFNNSLKYAYASCINLDINKVDNNIVFLYSDNGIGFDLEEKLQTASSSLGLFSIINRIKNLNGEYEIHTAPGQGFSLKISFLPN